MPQPFEDTDKPSSKPKVELKSQGKSMFDDQPKKPTKETAQKQAAVVNDRINSYNERAIETTTAFMKLLNDTTIPDNKNVFSADIEKEVIGKFQQLMLDIENDEQQLMGMGPIGGISFLMRVILMQRDKLNQLTYKQHLLEKQIANLEKTSKELAPK